MGVFHFTPIVLAASLVALPYLWLVMPRLLGDNRTEEVREERQFDARLRIGRDSELIGHGDERGCARACPTGSSSTIRRSASCNRSNVSACRARTRRWRRPRGS